MRNNLIGVSGKMNSGKDTIGQMIQLITLPGYGDTRCPNYNFHFDEKGKPITDIARDSEWKIKKFADKLKDIVCLLLGCTRDWLENREFKEKELGEEWSCFSYDNWANWSNIKTHEGIPDWPPFLSVDKVENMLSSHLRTLTPRTLLQLLGTECGRQIIHPNIWINATFADYKPIGISVNEYGDQIIEDLVYPNWILTDTRFRNEADAIRKRGGIVIRVDRPCIECNGMGYHKMDCGIGRLEHLSETDLDKYDFDYTIRNDGSIKDLLNVVKNIIDNDN